MKVRKANIIIGLLGMILLVSCQDSPFFSKYFDLYKSGWDSRDTMAFTLPQSDVDCVKTLSVGVRTTGKFKYNAITLLVTQKCDSVVVKEDTVTMSIYDSGGKPLGSGFPYILTECEVGKMNIQKKMDYTICITHLMRLNPLEEIVSVGMELK